jgi:Zn-dependent protease with chaperone function
MISPNSIYPPSPELTDIAILQPSAAYKKNVVRVAGSILFFIVVYFALIALSVVLTIFCAYGGIFLISLANVTTMALGVGLLSVGIMVMFFLIKFVFKTTTVDRSGLIEINEQDQPELFTFIRTITTETQSPFPKKIYLSADVNACVFYDSGFWSMFFPVRKNLQIGLALVNTVNVSEFKAILAHEFGHFSQNSMKLGSYVYHVNHVIYNMLYDNEGYGKTIEKWANIHSVFALFASITIGIVRGIQWVLKSIYELINKQYMSLSRQMEFHADTVAASVSGSSHLVNSLWRLEVAETCYQRLFQYYNEWITENLCADNLYPQHSEVITFFATDHNIPVQHGLPAVNAKTFEHFRQNRLVVKDQWASHPSTEDRETHLMKLNLRTDTIHLSAWNVFRDVENLQRQMTAKVYSSATFSKPPATLELESFRQKFHADIQKYSLNKAYKGFYDARNMKEFDPDILRERKLSQETTSLHEILNEENARLPLKINALRNDLQGLEMISHKSISVNTFDFDNRRYSAPDAHELMQQVKSEITDAEKNLVDTDERLFLFFLDKANLKNEGELLIGEYKNIFIVLKESEEVFKQCVDLHQIIGPIYQTIAFESVMAIMNQVRLHEPAIKKNMVNMLENASLELFLDEKQREKIKVYVEKTYVYFDGTTFNNQALMIMNEALVAFQGASFDRAFATKKALLDRQLMLLQ